jgi:D-glycerate 3-kinase
MFMGPQHFDYLVHLDTDDLVNVYEWRIQQGMRSGKRRIRV